MLKTSQHSFHPIPYINTTFITEANEGIRFVNQADFYFTNITYVATKEMLPILTKILNVEEIEVQIEFIQSTGLNELGDLKFLADGLKNVLRKI